MQLRLIFLGTSSAVPTAKRCQQSIAVVRGGEVLIFDVGECMQRNFLRSGIGVNRRMRIFITHMHGDHVLGLLGLLQTLALNGRDLPIYVYGPKVLNEYIEVNRRLLNINLTYNLYFNSVDGDNAIVVDEKDYVIKACRAEHSIPAYSYCLHEKDRPGVFYPEKALALGVPKGRLWHKLQHGEDVIVDGRVVRSSDVTGPKRKGRKIGISGDTIVNDRLVEFFSDCDVLVFESTFSHEDKAKAIEAMHSTARDAAELAVKARVKLLVLTHFSARYNDVKRLVDEASAIHSNVIPAEDMLTIDVPYPE
jgi:ribonuclease Z